MEAEQPAAQESPATAGQASAPETAEPETVTATGQRDAQPNAEQEPGTAAPGEEDAVMSEVAAAPPSTAATPGGPASSPERGETAAAAADPCNLPASAAPEVAAPAEALATAVLGNAPVPEDDDSEPEPVDIEGAEILEPGPGIDASLVEQEARIICQARELAKACARLRGERVQGALEKAAARLARRAAKLPGGGPQDPEPLTPEERAALMAALKDAAAASSFSHSGDPVPEGVSAVERLALQAFAGVDLDLSSAPPPLQPQPELALQPPQAAAAQQQQGAEVLQQVPTAPVAELGVPAGAPVAPVAPGPAAVVSANGPAVAPRLDGAELGTGIAVPGQADASAAVVQPGGGAGAAPPAVTTATEAASAPPADADADGNGAGAGGGGAGGEGEEGINVELLIRAGPDRVRLLVGALSLLLRRCLTPARVFPVLLLGRRLGLPELEEAALLAAIVNFGTAVRAGRQAFLQLEPGPLLLIVSNSQLQVSSELEVWQAITDWVGAAPGTRRPLLYELLRAGVRLGAMDTLQLDAVQRHPLLQGGDPGPAARLVNAAYSARIISNVTRSQSQGHGAGRHHGRVSHSGGHGSDGGAAAGGRTSLSGSGAATASGSHGGLGQRRPHAALQQLIGGLQARAAAAKAKQLQRQQQSHSQQQQLPQPQQPGAGPQQSVGSGDSGEGRLIGNGTREDSAPPPPMPDDAAGGGGGVTQPQQSRLPGSFLPPPNRPRSPLLQSSLPHGGAGQGALAPTPTSGTAPTRLGVPVSSSKSALAQMIVQAAGLSRISVGGEGGRNRLGAVQAALSGALSNPQLQEMLRKAKMGQMGGAGAAAGARAGGGGGPAAAPGGGLAPANAANGFGPGNGTAAAVHLRPPPLTVPAEAGVGGSGTGMTPAASATASTGLFSPPSAGGMGMATSTSTSGAAFRTGQTPGSATGGAAGEPGSARPPVALAPEQLLQIAAAVQKAVASGQAQPPHVQQQLANLRAFIARHLAAAQEGSPQHSMLTQLQATLAGAGQQQQQQPAPTTQGSGGEGAAAPALAQEPVQPLHLQPQRPGGGQGARIPGVGNSGTMVVDGTAAVTVAEGSDGAGKGDGGRVLDDDGGADAAEPPAKRQRQEA